MSEVASRVVYTALIGGHDALREQPMARRSGISFVCLTDDPDLTSDTWEVRQVAPALALDPVRSARALKVLGSTVLGEYDESLWIDARVTLSADPAEILDAWLTDADIVSPRHSYRKDVVSEFEEILVQGLEEGSRLYEQLTHYSVINPECLTRAVPWTGMLARRHTAEVARAMDEWWLHIVRYSRRDQLSFVHALAAAGIEPALLPLENFRSDLHEWHLGVGRTTRPPIFRVSESLSAPIAQLGELRRQLEHTATTMTRSVEAREERIASLERRIAQLDRVSQRRLARIEKLRARVARLRTVNADQRRRLELAEGRAGIIRQAARWVRRRIG